MSNEYTRDSIISLELFRKTIDKLLHQGISTDGIFVGLLAAEYLIEDSLKRGQGDELVEKRAKDARFIADHIQSSIKQSKYSHNPNKGP